MKMTLDDYYKSTYTEYQIELDNKGNFVYGKGIVGYQVIKEAEKEIKKVITKRRKNNIKANVLWNNKNKQIVSIYYR